MKKIMIFFIGLVLLLNSLTYAGSLTCFDGLYNSTIKRFECGGDCGNCVWWAGSKRPDLKNFIDSNDPTWTAGTWYDNAVKHEIDVRNNVEDVKVGSIVEFSKPAHVAHVEKTYEDYSFDVSEMDYGCDIKGLKKKHVFYGSYYPEKNEKGEYTGKYKRKWVNDDGTEYPSSGYGWTLKGFIYPQEQIQASQIGDIAIVPPVKSEEHCENAHKFYIIKKDGTLEETDREICGQVRNIKNRLNALLQEAYYRKLEAEAWEDYLKILESSPTKLILHSLKSLINSAQADERPIEEQSFLRTVTLWISSNGTGAIDTSNMSATMQGYDGKTLRKKSQF